jgi:pectate lyase
MIFYSVCQVLLLLCFRSLKMQKKILAAILFTMLLAFTCVSNSAFALPAFPGAEGFGTESIGGRGGKVYFVTNLNNSGSGSLRAAIEASGPRIVVFKTGGTISLSGTLTIANPYVTIAGQTAPGGGISIRGGDLRIATHDVIIRYITVRRGPGGENHALNIYKHESNDIYNIVIDHCSLSWATDENLASQYRVYNLTVSNTISSEALNCSTHSKGCHSKGAMFAATCFDNSCTDSGSFNISFHHNLLAHFNERGPLFRVSGTGDIVNNVIYNAANSMGMVVRYDLDSADTMKTNWVKNYFKYGPSSGGTAYEIREWDTDMQGSVEIYVEGNIGPHRTSDQAPEDYAVYPDSRKYIVGTRFTAPSITETSAADAYTNVLEDSGNSQGLSCDGSWFSRRDSVDQRIVNDVINKTGSMINDPSEVGGWPSIEIGTACTDTDSDGMPDAYETIVGFNPNLADASGDADKDGYTNIEEYLNGIDSSSDALIAPTGLRLEVVSSN